MALDIDILILFADADNEPSSNSDTAWVSQFKKFLEFMLNQVLNEKPKILLKGEYDTMTAPKLDNVSVLIPILSKDFIKSATCLEHLALFEEATGKNYNRIFKVGKFPVPLKEQPELLRQLIGYDLYQLDPDSDEIKEYSSYFSAEAERQYWMEIVDLSYDIAELLFQLKQGSSAPVVKNLFDPKIVYLAEVGHDLSVQRNIIRRELQRNGYTVLPTQTLPSVSNDIERIVRRDLEDCSMSIHLIGNNYGDIPEGGSRSVADLQHIIAAEKSQEAGKKNTTFQRLIWISPNLSHTSERQKSFIETIKRDVELQEGAEILETPLEDFKNIIREELLESIDRKAVKETGGRAIYLLYDKEDHDNVKPYVDLIEKSGFHVLIPTFNGELLEQRIKHMENLRALDAAIIYKGKTSEQWVRMKALDIMKAPGFGRKKPIVAKAILAPLNGINNREPFDGQNFRFIEGDATHSVESLKLFLLEFTN
jgi:hypothetical protein